jgi:Icc protein
MTDIHLQPELGAEEAFQRVIDTANALKRNFIMTGGDLVFDVLRGNMKRSDALFESYKRMIKGFNPPVYNGIGNHQLFGIYEGSDVTNEHPDYEYGLFERHLGKSYYSFDHEGWHFIVLNLLRKETSGLSARSTLNKWSGLRMI